MELYTSVSYDLSRRLTLCYSTSFGLACRLYSRAIRPHIYAIYGMVRLADEIVDTYQGDDRAELLQAFNDDVTAAVNGGYSSNPIIHAFAETARLFKINSELIDPFFASMYMDLGKTDFTDTEYKAYIYGSAEVIGLMCLRIFCDDKQTVYDLLAPGAQLLGSSYQKINFLRDFAADYHQRGRVYFPGLSFETFDDTTKAAIVADIAAELHRAKPSIDRLPRSSRRAVRVSVRYYRALLDQLQTMSAQQIKDNRAHVSMAYKVAIFTLAAAGLA
jgi:phytoene synthase